MSGHTATLAGKFGASLKCDGNTLEDKNHYTKILSVDTAHDARAGIRPWGIVSYTLH